MSDEERDWRDGVADVVLEHAIKVAIAVPAALVSYAMPDELKYFYLVFLIIYWGMR